MKRSGGLNRQRMVLWSLPSYLEELHSDARKHELQQRGDDHDVANGPDGHEDALDHVLQESRDTRAGNLISTLNKNVCSSMCAAGGFF